MAILTSMPGEGNAVGVYDVPENVLSSTRSQEISGSMFPESNNRRAARPKEHGRNAAEKVENAESLGEVQALVLLRLSPALL